MVENIIEKWKKGVDIILMQTKIKGTERKAPCCAQCMTEECASIRVGELLHMCVCVCVCVCVRVRACVRACVLSFTLTPHPAPSASNTTGM